MLFELVSNENEIICKSDNTWKVSKNGATVHNAIRKGEYYDARKESAWTELSYDEERGNFLQMGEKRRAIQSGNFVA